MRTQTACLVLALGLAAGMTEDSSASAIFAEHATVEARDIADAIKRGEGVMLDSCVVVGKIELLGQGDERDTIGGFILIARSTFTDSVIFRHWTFAQPVGFRGSTFGSYTYFGDVSFDEPTGFDRVTFSGNAHFRDVVFRARADFEGATFGEELVFWSSTFGDVTRFWDACFEGPACFFEDTLQAYTDFGSAVFKSTGNFGGTRFAQTSFTSTTFEEDVVFTDAVFTDRVSFSLATFGSFYARWSQLAHFINADYRFMSRLIRNFEELRFLGDADDCYLFLRDNERKKKPWLRRHAEYWLLQATCGYGVKPERLFFWSFGVILVFMLFYTRNGAILQRDILPASARRRRLHLRMHSSGTAKLRDAFFYSFQTFLVGAVPGWCSTDQFLINSRRLRLIRFRTLSMIEGALGWVLLILFVVTLTRKFIR